MKLKKNKITNKDDFFIGAIVMSYTNIDNKGVLSEFKGDDMYFNFKGYKSPQRLGINDLRDMGYFLIDPEENPEYYL